jgi:hypothetical protein
MGLDIGEFAGPRSSMMLLLSCGRKQPAEQVASEFPGVAAAAGSAAVSSPENPKNTKGLSRPPPRPFTPVRVFRGDLPCGGRAPSSIGRRRAGGSARGVSRQSIAKLLALFKKFRGD